jgi:hypothetical protein
VHFLGHGIQYIAGGGQLKGTQEGEFFGFDFEFCSISLLVMHK